MADVTSFSPKLQNFSARLGTLRTRGLRAALGTSAPPVTAPKELPSLQGEALAKQHLALAIDAMRGPGVSKPEGYRKLRLLLNGLEQGAHTPSNKPVRVTNLPQTTSRRARLMNRAFESVQAVSAWRSPESDDQHN